VFARSRCRAGLASLVLAAAVLCTWPAAAAVASTTTTVKCPTPEILGGITANGATVTTPGAKPRTLDKDQATAFMQTWLAYSVFKNPPQEHPPAGVPISRLNVAMVQGGQPSPLLIFYATDGIRVWVGAPAPAPAAPPNDQKWIRVPKPKETSAAFAGKMAPICTDPVTATSTTAPAATTTVGLAAKPTGKSSDGAPWALIVAGIVVVVGGGSVVALRSRRRAAA
jgi:hypothetical protein